MQEKLTIGLIIEKTLYKAGPIRDMMEKDNNLETLQKIVDIYSARQIYS